MAQSYGGGHGISANVQRHDEVGVVVLEVVLSYRFAFGGAKRDQ